MEVDTKTFPRIDGSHKDGEIWKFRINDWFNRDGITTRESKFSYIIAADDDIIRVLIEKQSSVNRALDLDECVDLIKKKYWRENKKFNKLRQLKRFYSYINTRFLNLYDQLESSDKSSISVIDYENSLRPRFQVYERVTMAETGTIEEACSLAEKYENILKES
ncbi:hypothetical protein BCR32DRAFT_287720 [Anaeromyces robustus]|uniref:Uncharacterized protein n=1 Tax=Anaeromyces robustus TaxID=1754192 RepID=A0A1Y1VQE9_9FUNG|nr:hypothetical protein BCR32DRAFT_287720 [Anaeromyces robustus]|eukprot:ORX63499.1 hypothetical protein BCR32DRAFT_287720 [Anaeromyces robustus]